jgi:acetamidase/formamidase
LPYGLELPLAPFFGVMGVASKPEYGPISTVQPREHGGNLDNKELGEGATLFLPVWVPGAMFSAGDGHGVQGDGEVCINALEICLTGTFTLTLHKKHGDQPLLTYPRGETATHYISMGMNADLDLAMKQALRQMIAFICAKSNLSPQEAYQFCSLAVDFHVTQTVNGEQGVHGMLKKGLLFP